MSSTDASAGTGDALPPFDDSDTIDLDLGDLEAPSEVAGPARAAPDSVQTRIVSIQPIVTADGDDALLIDLDSPELDSLNLKDLTVGSRRPAAEHLTLPDDVSVAPLPADLDNFQVDLIPATDADLTFDPPDSNTATDPATIAAQSPAALDGLDDLFALPDALANPSAPPAPPAAPLALPDLDLTAAPASDASDRMAAPRLMDDDWGAPTAAVTRGASAPSAPVTHRSGRRWVRFAAVGATAIVAVALAGAWFLREVLPSVHEALEPAPSPTPPTTSAEPVPIAVPTPPVTPQENPAPPDIDRLNYPDLVAAAAALAARATPSAEEGDLLLWAWYRLAQRYGESDALNNLVRAAPKRIDAPDVSGRAAAAAVGGMALQGDAATALPLATRLLAERHTDSPHLHLVAANLLAAEPVRAAAHSARALALQTNLPDARYAFHVGALRRRTPDAADALVAFAAEMRDVDLATEVAGLMLAAGDLVRAEIVTRPLQDPALADQVSPGRRAAFLRLIIAQRVLAGDLTTAATAADSLAALQPDRLTLRVMAAALHQSAGKDGRGQLVTVAGTLQREGDQAYVLYEQLALALSAGDLPAAEKSTDDMSKLAGPIARSWWTLARGRLAVARQEARAATWIAAARGQPDTAVLAQLYLASENADAAARLREISKLARRGRHPTVDLHLAQAMAETGNAAGALKIADAILWKAPWFDDASALVTARLESMARAGRVAEANQAAETLYRARPDDRAPIQLLIRLAERAGQANAVADWTRLLVNQKPDLGNQILLARRLMDADRHGEARSLLEQLHAIEANRHDPDLLVVLGRAFAERDPVRARSHLVEARGSKPTVEVFLLLAAIDAARGKIDTAAEAYQAALKMDPGSIEAHVGMARILAAEGRLSEAEDHLRFQVKARPTDPEALLQWADLMVEMNRHQDALRAYRQAAERNGVRPDVYVKIAKIQLHHLDQVAAAIQTLRQAIRIDPKTHEAYYLLGYALKDSGQKKEAIAALQQYLNVAPKDALAETVRADLEELLRQP